MYCTPTPPVNPLAIQITPKNLDNGHPIWYTYINDDIAPLEL